MQLFLTILAAVVVFLIAWPLLVLVFKLTLGLVHLALVALVIIFIIGLVRRLLRV